MEDSIGKLRWGAKTRLQDRDIGFREKTVLLFGSVKHKCGSMEVYVIMWFMVTVLYVVLTSMYWGLEFPLDWID